MKIRLIAATICILSIYSCSKTEDTCNTDNITYTNTISGLFATCTAAGCHNSGSTNGSGSLANYTDAKAFVAKGRTIGALRHDAGFVAMPQGQAKLNDCDINKVEKWIADGTPN